MPKFKFPSLVYFLLFAIPGCNPTYTTQAVQYSEYKISTPNNADSRLQGLLKPYADSVNKSMNDVIAVAEVSMEKGHPEGTLGNLLADIMLSEARKMSTTPVDVAFINPGGIRLSSISAGNITRGKIFELAPFDNIIVLLKLTGKQLQELLDLTATRGGWPVAGLTMQIKNRQAISVKIKNNSLDSKAMYVIALPDYVANGGDDASMLRAVPQQSNGYVFRDAVIKYLSEMNKQGIKISSKIENRVTNAE